MTGINLLKVRQPAAHYGMLMGRMKRKKLIGKAFAVVMALSVIMMFNVSAFADTAPETKYTPNEYYFVGESELAGLPAVDGYYWTKQLVSEGRYDTENPICGIPEHQHSSATEADCMGYELSCNTEEHIHSSACASSSLVCGVAEHEHSFSCYSLQLTCQIEEHNHTLDCIKGFRTVCGKEYHQHNHLQGCYSPVVSCGSAHHTDSCYSCEKPEHTHSTYGGACYTKKSCDILEHVHSAEAGCYNYIEAQYKVMLLKSGDDQANNGNEWLVIKVKVNCADGKTNAAGVDVHLTANDYTEGNASIKVLEKDATTGPDGLATFKISSTYDKASVTVDGKSVVNGARVGWTVGKWNVTYNYTMPEHKWIESASTATCTESGTADRKCKCCGAQETIEKEALGHNLKDVDALDPTCETKGHKAGKVCQRAGCTYTEGMEEITALGHKYDAGKVIKEPTYTEKGIKRYTCTNDSRHTYDEPIDELTSEGEGEIVTPGPGGDGEIIPPGSGGDGGIITPPIPNPGPSGDTDPVVPGTPDTPDDPGQVDPSGDSEPADDGNIDAEPEGDAAETADTDAEDSEAKGVKTGDETMLAMWGALGLIAALGLGGALVIGRRREE